MIPNGRCLFRFLVVLSCLVCSVKVFSQSFETRYVFGKEDVVKLIPSYQYERSFSTELEQEKDIQEELSSWRSKGYLAAGIDSVVQSNNKKTIFLYLGSMVKLARVNFLFVPDEMLQEVSGATTKKTEFASAKAIADMCEGLLVYLENNGYPFAKLKLQESSYQSDGLSLSYALDKGNQIVYDTIAIKGDAKVSRSFINNYLQIKTGDLYNESLVKQVGRKMNGLQFLRLKEKPKVYFTEGKAHLVLDLENRKSDRIDGLIGFAPNSSNKQNKLLLTGEFNLDLKNMFQSGKRFNLHWQSFLERSQKLETAISLPYFLSSQFGLTGEFDLLKADTLFLNLRNKLGVDYFFNADQRFKVFYEYQGTSLISVDTMQVRRDGALPINNPTKANYYGIEFASTKFDYPFNPRRGYSVRLSAALGTKRILKDNQIEQVQFGENGYDLYDSLSLKETQYKWNYSVQKYVPLGKSATFLFSSYGAGLFAEQLFSNEEFRIGGFSDLRGFDEESMLATTYSVLHLEYRYLLSRNAYLQAFWNGAYTEKNRIMGFDYTSDWPFGFGAGISFETTGGIFSLLYALGSEQGNAVDFRKGKVHFGISSVF